MLLSFIVTGFIFEPSTSTTPTLALSSVQLFRVCCAHERSGTALAQRRRATHVAGLHRGLAMALRRRRPPAAAGFRDAARGLRNTCPPVRGAGPLPPGDPAR